MLNHIDHTRDEGLKVRVVDVDSALAVSWQVEHDYFFAAFPEAVEEGEEVVSCWVDG